MTGRDRKTIRKKAPGIKTADKISARGGSALVDRYNDDVNRRKNGRVVTHIVD